MADNVEITAGTGTPIATDEIAGVNYQRIKVTYGVDGVAGDVSDTNPLPVKGTATRVLDNAAPGLPVRQIGQEVFNVSFSEVGASVISPEFGSPIVGTGVGFSQGGGALAITTGTTANAEFLARSATTFRGAMRLRSSIVLSQRIANQNFAVLLADLIGAGLAFTINSATSISVTRTAHGFTAQNIGQFMLIGGIAGAAGVPGRYAIASIPNADTINFTVSGWPATGSGTLTLFGHSYVRNLFNGTTATSALVDTQRRGWAAGDTTITTNTTVSPGTILQAELTGREVLWSDFLRASVANAGSISTTTRASRFENIPDDNLDLHIFLWSFNGSTAPASTTTWTISFLSVERFANLPVYIQGFRTQGTFNPVPVLVLSAQPALVAGTALVGDVGIQVRTAAAGGASVRHIVAAAGTNATNVKASSARLYGWQFANTTASWRYVKLHNTAGAPTAGSGVIMTIGIPPNGQNSLFIDTGVASFATGLAFTIVTGAADTDATGATANDVVGTLFFA